MAVVSLLALPGWAAPPALVIRGDDAVVVEFADLSALQQRPRTWERGDLKGWRLVGDLVPGMSPARVGRIEVTSRRGQQLVLQRPHEKEAGRVAVVLPGPDGTIRFAMETGDGHRVSKPSPPSAVPHALDDVVAIRVVQLPPDAVVTEPVPEPSVQGAFALRVGGRVQEFTPEVLRTAFGGATRWPLREVVRRATTAPVAQVVVRARDDTVTFDAKAWDGTGDATLRLNRRGLMKLESSLGVARDVRAVDVTLR